MTNERSVRSRNRSIAGGAGLLAAGALIGGIIAATSSASAATNTPTPSPSASTGMGC